MMSTSRREQRGRRMSAKRRRRLTATIASAVALIVVAVIATVAVVQSVAAQTPVAAPPAEMETPSPEPTPLSPTEALLAEADDPDACAVTFLGDGIGEEPQLQREGALYEALPIPRRDDAVFAGWYATPEDAAAFTVGGRVNGADLVACTDREVALHGAWKSPDEVAAEDVGVPILMYHQFTTRPEGEDHWLAANYAYIGDFEAHMAHLAENDFYLPTWDELGAFIDGALYLPRLSSIVTDDDADQTWFDLAVPVVERYRIPTTSFVITAARQEPTPSMWVMQRSHTHDMHTAGDNGRGRMESWSADEIAADLEISAEILGAKDVVAYPFGHHNETTKEGVRQAGFEFGRTVDPGYVRAGTDKLALPVIRINYGMGLDAFRDLVG